MKANSTRMTVGLMALCAAGITTWAAEGWTTYNSKPGPGNLITIEGTSTVHDWRVEGKIIGGKFEAGPGFTTNLDEAKPGKIEAKADIFIPVRSLKSFKDGKPYSTSMDDIMYEKLLEKDHKLIKFSLKELTLKEVHKGADGDFLFEAKGDLAVAGVTQSVVMPVSMRVDGTKLTFMGGIDSKMSDFKIETPVALGGTIKTGNEIKLGLSWVVAGK